MSDPEGFLSRWSRRKREAEKAEPEAVGQESASAEETVDAATREPESGEGKTKRAERPARDEEAPAEPAFDLSKLPPIESITADTDIRGFLAPGVPPDLTRAALRRVWVIDPKIRDFIEIAENQWDFTAPGVPGFDLSPPAGDIARMIADMLPRGTREESTPASDEAQTDASSPGSSKAEDSHRELIAQAEKASASSAMPESQRQTSPAGENAAASPQSPDDIALQQDAAPQESAPRRRRGHGGAMPS